MKKAMKVLPAIWIVTGIILVTGEANDAKSQLLLAVIGVMVACVGGDWFSYLCERDDE